MYQWQTLKGIVSQFQKPNLKLILENKDNASGYHVQNDNSLI